MHYVTCYVHACRCSRPYMAEIGFVCDGPNSYQLWLGGNLAQTAMAQEYKERVKIRELEATLEPLLAYWKAARKADEGFGYFVHRVGLDALREYEAGYVAQDVAQHDVQVVDDLYAKLQERAASEGKSVAHVTNQLLSKAMS